MPSALFSSFFFFFFNDTATTEIYTLSLHDALPISRRLPFCTTRPVRGPWGPERDRKSTRLNSSHVAISYAVFCLKKKTTTPVHLSLRPATRKLRNVPRRKQIS